MEAIRISNLSPEEYYRLYGTLTEAHFENYFDYIVEYEELERFNDSRYDHEYLDTDDLLQDVMTRLSNDKNLNLTIEQIKIINDILDRM